jgi:uncharacterized protein (TIGR00255 family)
MLLSMTGYGRAALTEGDTTFIVEIRSLNSKYTDIRSKVPSYLREKEVTIRKIVTDAAHRGKFEMTIEIQSDDGQGEFGLNRGLFRRYHRELSELSSELGMSQADMLSAIIRLPNVVMTEADSISDEQWELLQRCLRAALDRLYAFRLQEGEATERDLRERIHSIQQLQAQIPPFETERTVQVRERMQRQLDEFMGKDNVDKNRYEQEVLFYLEKMAINEEMMRLEQHCRYFLEALDEEKDVKGRKLNFISQEIGREINTLGSKAYSADIQRLVVGMKDELEKIKEQIANVV